MLALDNGITDKTSVIILYDKKMKESQPIWTLHNIFTRINFAIIIHSVSSFLRIDVKLLRFANVMSRKKKNHWGILTTEQSQGGV